MESINVDIDYAILEKSVGEDGEAPSLKKNDGDGNMSQSDDGERQSPKNESTLTASRRETRSTQGSLNPLTSLEFSLQSCVMKNPPLPRNPCRE